MEQKEQKVVTPKVTVTVEKYGKTSTTEGKGIIGFVLTDDGVRCVLSLATSFFDRVRLFDAMCTICCDMMEKEPELKDVVMLMPPSIRKKVDIFDDGEES